MSTTPKPDLDLIGLDLQQHSSSTDSSILVDGSGKHRAVLYAAIATAVTVISGFALLPLWLNLAAVWTHDPLRSIGAAFPIISLLGVLFAWRRLQWELDGRSWALLLVLVSIPLARIVSFSNLDIVFHSHRLGLMHPGPVLFLYGVGATLLFGGPRLLRAAILPLCLLLFVDPVPRIYNSLVDLPLQQFSADTARAFSRLIGLHPTGLQLKMMFTPDFGMMIVPGCNGVRGSITLAYLVLIFGYTRRLRPRSLALVTLLGFVTGYGLNLMRLCVLVIYYRIGVSYPSIQPYGVGVDYCIGCTLFLCITLGFGLLIRSLEPADVEAARLAAAGPRPFASQHSASQHSASRPNTTFRSTLIRAACLLLVAAIFIAPQLRTLAAAPTLRVPEDVAVQSLPRTVGPYRLTRTYTEHDTNGMIVFALGDYEAPSTAGLSPARLTFGLWVGGPGHLVVSSKLDQGLHPQSIGAFDASTAAGQHVHFATSLFDDGISRQENAEAACSPQGCTVQVAGSANGLIFRAPNFNDLAFAPEGKRLPILVRREWADSDPTPTAQLQSSFRLDASLFIHQLDLKPLVAKLGARDE